MSDMARKAWPLVLIVLVVVLLSTVLIMSRRIAMLIFGATLFAVFLRQLAEEVFKRLPFEPTRRVKISIIITALLLLTVLSAFGTANSVSDKIAHLVGHIDQSVDDLQSRIRSLPIAERLMSHESGVSSLVPSSDTSMSFVSQMFSSTFGFVLDLLIILVLGGYFAISPQKYRNGAIRLLPVHKRIPISSLLGEAAETLWRWVLGRLAAMAMIGVAFGIGLAFLGIPMPLQLGVFAALVTFVPNVGGVVAVVPALLLATEQGSSAVLGVLGLYLTLQTIESYFITPMIEEHQVELPPGMVIIAQLVAAILFGLWGIVFATPLFAVISLFVKRLYIEQWLEAPAAEPAVCEIPSPNAVTSEAM